MPIGLVVHAGAGDIPEHEYEERLAGCRAAVAAGLAPLHQGGTALDAVELAVRVLEDHPLLNAGYGAGLNRDGVVELDAMIMDGQSHKIGAVAAVQGVRHPVSLARQVMEHSPYHLLVGTGAERFAIAQGIPLVDPASLITPQRWLQHTRSAGDTVGAVALDSLGNVAVAVSTGGLTGKMPGRVGDSAIAGAGGYAETGIGAACATGVGEGIMRALLTFRAVQAIENGLSAQAAAEHALEIFTTRFEGSGGLIVIDQKGEIGVAHNTHQLPIAYTMGDRILAQIAGTGLTHR